MRLGTSFAALLRLCGAIIFALIGWAIADVIPPAILPPPLNDSLLLHLAMAVPVGLIGLLLLPRLAERPMNDLIEHLAHASAAQLIATLVGFMTGLLVAALVAFPLALLPEPFRQVLPVLAAVVFSYIGTVLFNARYKEVFHALNVRVPGIEESPPALAAPNGASGRLLLDTSVIIDGRVADISTTGFLRGDIVVPRFVLNELQYIADSPDALRRARGRRGLEVLKRLQQESRSPVRIVDSDTSTTRAVDEKLVVLAKQWDCPIMTNDYNLSKVAQLQGVTVMNINELANAVKSVVLPGEAMTVRVIQLGKEQSQGVAYLDDGTMIVVENGSAFLDRTVDVTVTKVLQTSAGRMIFAKP